MDPVEVLRRWEESGGTWRVLGTHGDELTISLRTCTAGEEAERLVSGDLALIAYVGGRSASDD
ncbi:MAG: hypothetical protein J2O46_07740 [Nocardioides sp.]|nr:hypothetical protein [Nocardioides sp.]